MLLKQVLLTYLVQFRIRGDVNGPTPTARKRQTNIVKTSKYKFPAEAPGHFFVRSICLTENRRVSFARISLDLAANL